ncbi:MAG: hypothetical protein EP330_10095 [Deltaproteobacteria bacterium]|nr:MAG: hypothetical protein EP330_10095 [Deltaproteobacteria bacterium]
MRTAAIALLLLPACATPLSADFAGPPYLTLAGAVELAGPPGDAAVTGAVAWAWTEGSQMHTAVVEVPFEPEVYFYRLTVPGPPDVPPAATGDAPPGLAEEPLLIGLPLLLQTEVEVVADPSGMARWLAGERVPAADWLDPGEGRVLAWADEHLLIGMATGGADHLGETPGIDLSALCGVADVAAGLTLYQRAADVDCPDVWEALSAPGERTDFQGVDMRSP